jgi:hypothetical protein
MSGELPLYSSTVFITVWYVLWSGIVHCLDTHVLPSSGHVLCASCCVGIIDSTETSTLCPFCRNPYTRDGVRVIRIESEASLGDSSGEGSSRLEDYTPSDNTTLSAGQRSQLTRAFHQAKCDFCTSAILGERFVRLATRLIKSLMFLIHMDRSVLSAPTLTRVHPAFRKELIPLEVQINNVDPSQTCSHHASRSYLHPNSLCR